jgi:hypothetical protein
MHQYAEKGDFTYRRAIDKHNYCYFTKFGTFLIEVESVPLEEKCRHSWSADPVVVGCL